MRRQHLLSYSKSPCGEAIGVVPWEKAHSGISSSIVKHPQELHYSSAYAPRRGWHIGAWINTHKPHAFAIVCRWLLLWRINSSRKLSQSYTASTCICKLSFCHLVVWAITNTFVYTSLIHILFDYLNIANTFKRLELFKYMYNPCDLTWFINMV